MQATTAGEWGPFQSSPQGHLHYFRKMSLQRNAVQRCRRANREAYSADARKLPLIFLFVLYENLYCLKLLFSAADSSSPSAKPPGRARREPRPPRDSEPPPPYVAEPEDKIRNVLNGIRNKAETYKNEIRAFDERSDNNKFYHIDENLKKLVDALDDMRQQVAGNDVLLRDRNEVYEYIFHLLGELDKKLEENKRTFQENKQKTIFVTI
ncbi:uncharacterized protein [Euwallacea fornicatus]|uniref:uncharacterized protein isoform X1 n=1 Tax=Euwallacea fornicatus TaxID=995702 RepID=UPI00338F9067